MTRSWRSVDLCYFIDNFIIVPNFQRIIVGRRESGNKSVDLTWNDLLLLEQCQRITIKLQRIIVRTESTYNDKIIDLSIECGNKFFLRR